jgi:hypothetical protein
MEGQGHQRELATNAETFYQEGINDILIGFGRPGMAAEKLAFYFGQVEHSA